MTPRVVDARLVGDHTLWIRFKDGVEGEVDLGRELKGEIFQPLKDRAFFRKFKVHPELHTITWPNGADFAPEFLYSRIKILT